LSSCRLIAQVTKNGVNFLKNDFNFLKAFVGSLFKTFGFLFSRIHVTESYTFNLIKLPALNVKTASDRKQSIVVDRKNRNRKNSFREVLAPIRQSIPKEKWKFVGYKTDLFRQD